jgi:hypothetical protein
VPITRADPTPAVIHCRTGHSGVWAVLTWTAEVLRSGYGRKRAGVPDCQRRPTSPIHSLTTKRSWMFGGLPVSSLPQPLRSEASVNFLDGDSAARA